MICWIECPRPVEKFQGEIDWREVCCCMLDFRSSAACILGPYCISYSHNQDFADVTAYCRCCSGSMLE